MRSRTRDLPACSIVTQLKTLLRGPRHMLIHWQIGNLRQMSGKFRPSLRTSWQRRCRMKETIKKIRCLSPRVNYTDRATASCRRSKCQLLEIEECRGLDGGSPRPYSRFLDRSRYVFFQVAPQLYLLSGPRSRPTTNKKSGSAGKRTRTSGSVARNSEH
jgi:hypothetical protein